MSGNYYVGNGPNLILDQYNGGRYFYALRIDENEFLYLTKVDMVLDKTSSVNLNESGPDSTKDFENFEFGVDFFDKRLPNKEDDPEIKNMRYQQYRWDSKNIDYEVNADGELIVKIDPLG
jgi:hypothetical protein